MNKKNAKIYIFFIFQLIIGMIWSLILNTEDTQDEEKQKHKQQLEVKTKPTYILCRNRKGHHNTNSERKDTK
jgi:hypothetical protein